MSISTMANKTLGGKYLSGRDVVEKDGLSGEIPLLYSYPHQFMLRLTMSRKFYSFQDETILILFQASPFTHRDNIFFPGSL